MYDHILKKSLILDCLFVFSIFIWAVIACNSMTWSKYAPFPLSNANAHSSRDGVRLVWLVHHRYTRYLNKQISNLKCN